MALTMGVSSNRGIPQYLWLQGKDWLVSERHKAPDPKGIGRYPRGRRARTISRAVEGTASATTTDGGTSRL